MALLFSSLFFLLFFAPLVPLPSSAVTDPEVFADVEGLALFALLTLF